MDLTFIECLKENRPRIEIRAGTADLNELGNAIRVTKVQTGSDEEEQWMKGVERNRARAPSPDNKVLYQWGAIRVRDMTTFNPIGENKMQCRRDAGNADRYWRRKSTARKGNTDIKKKNSLGMIVIRNSSVGIVTRQRAAWSIKCGSILIRVKRFLCSAACRLSVGHTQPIWWVPRIKKSRREAEHSLPSKAEVKNAWSHTSAISYAFVA